MIDYAEGEDYGKGFMQPPEYNNVVVDVHRYHCFDPFLRTLPYKIHLNITCGNDVGIVQKQPWKYMTGRNFIENSVF